MTRRTPLATTRASPRWSQPRCGGWTSCSPKGARARSGGGGACDGVPPQTCGAAAGNGAARRTHPIAAGASADAVGRRAACCPDARRMGAEGTVDASSAHPLSAPAWRRLAPLPLHCPVAGRYFRRVRYSSCTDKWHRESDKVARSRPLLRAHQQHCQSLDLCLLMMLTPWNPVSRKFRWCRKKRVWTLTAP